MFENKMFVKLQGTLFFIHKVLVDNVLYGSQLQFLQKKLRLTKYLVKHVIKRISHDLRWYYNMIFIRVVRFLSSPQGSGIGNCTHNSLDKNDIPPQIMRDPICIN